MKVTNLILHKIRVADNYFEKQGRIDSSLTIKPLEKVRKNEGEREIEECSREIGRDS